MARFAAMTQRGKRNVAKSAFEPLAKTHPELAAQWHPTKNGNVTPNDVWANYSKHFSWRCEKGHEWEQRIRSRTVEGYGCPYCSKLKTATEDSLAVLRPEVAKEWHPTKNGKLKPDAVAPGSNKKVWWQCSKNPAHEWPAVVFTRTRMNAGDRKSVV